MIAHFDNRLTYVGTLDDVVDRYPWPSHLGLPELRQQLITDAIYGKKLLVNDGYLIANPKLANELKDIGKSLLGNLLREGDAHLFARGGVTKNLAAGLEDSAAKGISTHKEIMDKPDWKSVRDNLEYLSSKIANYTVAWPEDKNMGELFANLMARVRGMEGAERKAIIEPSLNDDFDAVYNSFLNDMPSSFNGARTIWERCCWQHFSGRDVNPLNVAALPTIAKREATFKNYAKVRALMNVANEVYHLAYSVGAGHAVRSACPRGIDNATVGVSTALVTAFPDLIGESLTDETPLDTRKVAALNRLLISIPATLEFKDDFSFIAQLRGNSSCRAAGKHYLETLRKFIAEPDGSETECRAARDEYAVQLAKIMAPAIELDWVLRMEKKLIDLIKTPIDLGLEVLIPGGGKFAGMVVGELGPKKYRVSKLVERLFTMTLERRAKKALVEEGILAAQSADSLQLVRKLGFYSGPLKADGLGHVARQVKPHPDLPRNSMAPL